MIKKIVVGVLCLCFSFSMTVNAAAVQGNYSDVSIDGNFSDWADKPFSWEFGYDNSNEVWNGWFSVNGRVEQCEKGTFNNAVRNKISLYNDSENIYVYVQYAEAYNEGFSGEDFEFTFDGKMAAYQLFARQVDFSTPGIYEIEIRDRKTYALADGAVGKILIHENSINNELEIKIPFTAIEMQKPEIDTENFGTLQFKASHLMYRPITSSGADTMPFVWAFAALLIVPASAFLIRKHNLRKIKNAKE